MRGGPLAAALFCMALAAGLPASQAAASEPNAHPSPTGSSSAHVSPARPLFASSSPARPSSAPSSPARPSALVLFLAANHQLEQSGIEQQLGSIPTLSTAILSATQGSYTTTQLLLDITQGTRVSNSAYSSPAPALRLNTASAQIQPWTTVLARARRAPQLLEPGLLAAQIPGGAAYVPAAGAENLDGALAANRSGHIAAIAHDEREPLRAIQAARMRHQLVVADLPAGEQGYAELRELAAARPSGELLIVLQRIDVQASGQNGHGQRSNTQTSEAGGHRNRSNTQTSGQAGHELSWIALAGVGGQHTLTSQTTNQRGLVAAIDIGPTILHHLGLSIPADMRGRSISGDGPLDYTSLRALKARLEVLNSRRLPALAWLVLAWMLLLTIARLPVGTDRRRRMRTAWAMRSGALAMLWTPVAVLLPAALEPSRSVEFVLLIAFCFTLGALTDRLLPWPRAPLAPAVLAIIALTVDALAGTQLLMRSLLGPNPAFGARFYGIGNELKSGLAVLVFTAVAAALYPAMRSRRTATIMAGAGVLLAIVEGSARIGAGVGGVILVSAGTAVATAMLLPGTLNRKRSLTVMAAPIVGLVLLAAIDLLTAHGNGHFTGSVLDARSPGDIRDIIVRRYGAAWDELKNHLMPLATALALIASVLAVRRRERVCAPVDSDPAWLAALCGGLTAGVIGALAEDSGPVLLVVAVFTLGCVLSYLWGKPARIAANSPSTAIADARGRLAGNHASLSGSSPTSIIHTQRAVLSKKGLTVRRK